MSVEAFMELVMKNKVATDRYVLTVLSNHVKIYTNDYFTHYRLSLEDWQTVKKQFAAALKLHTGK